MNTITNQDYGLAMENRYMLDKVNAPKNLTQKTIKLCELGKIGALEGSAMLRVNLKRFLQLAEEYKS